MRVQPTAIPGLVVIEPEVFEDDRGFFMETYQKDDFRKAGLDREFVQDNHSKSRRGTLRGLHYQIRRPQGKLVRIVSGEVFDVAVDIRRESATFGQWAGAYLSETNRKQFYIPPGFAHGFCVISETAETLYKCTDFYCPESERTIIWNDPQLAIDWPVDEPVLSERDAGGLPLAEAELPGDSGRAE